MNYTQNNKIRQVTEETLVVGIDIGSDLNYARAFDWRGIELSKRVFRFRNTREGFQSFEEWINEMSKENGKTQLIVGCRLENS